MIFRLENQKPVKGKLKQEIIRTVFWELWESGRYTTSGHLRQAFLRNESDWFN